jgi:hypothetical protein
LLPLWMLLEFASELLFPVVSLLLVQVYSPTMSSDPDVEPVEATLGPLPWLPPGLFFFTIPHCTVTANVDPTPLIDDTVMSPPIKRASCFEIMSPRPQPDALSTWAQKRSNATPRAK